MFVVDFGGHLEIELARPGFLILQLVWCDEPGSEGGGEVLGLGWAETDFHLAYLDVSRAPIVHYSVARYVGFGFRFRYVNSASPDYTRNFKLIVESLGVGWIGHILFGTVDHMRVRVVEGGKLVPLLRHRKASSRSGRLDVVFECVKIS